MAIRAELSSDKERGPGHGWLRVGGFDPEDEALELSLMRNQGTAPYLGDRRLWQATEAWHTAADVKRAGDEVVIRVGPEIIDAIVAQSITVAYRLTVAAGPRRDSGTLKVSRPLLGSEAASATDRSDAATTGEARAVQEVAEAGEAEEAPTRHPSEAGTAESEDSEPPTAPGIAQLRRRVPLVVLAALAAVGFGAGAWHTCWLPGIGASRCEGSLEPASSDGGDTPPAIAPGAAIGPGAASAPEAPGASCTGLDAATCLAKAERAMEAAELELSRQLFQEAAGLGAVEANNRLARMYDPETWSGDKSPVAEADWETAAYWYEAAARQNNVAGKSGAGRLLCRHAATSFERRRALEYLRSAAEAGDEKAKAMIAECEAKAS